MSNAEIFGALKESGAFDGSLFRPMNYRLALFLLAPDLNDLERFFTSGVRHALRHTESVLSLMSPTTVEALLGPENSPLRIGLNRAVQVADLLRPDAVVADAKLVGTRQFLQDAALEEAARTHRELNQLRIAAASRMEGFPDRLAKYRGLAEVALAQSMLTRHEDRITQLDDAVSRLSDITDQPVGSRDAFSWLLYGWAISLRDGFTYEAMNALSHACLTSSGVQDCIFCEAHRMLAHAQAVTGSADTAYQSIRKALASGSNSETQLELARFCAASHRKAESQEAFATSLAAQPLNLLSVFVDPELLVQANVWTPSATSLDRKRTDEAMARLNEWAQKLGALEQLQNDTPLEFELDPTYAVQHNDLSLSLSAGGFFDTAFVCSEAGRLQSDSIASADRVAQRLYRDASDAVQTSAGNIEALRLWKRDAVDSIQSQQQAKKHQARMDLGLYQAVSDKAQTGCVFSLGVGCLGYSFYFTLSIVWATFAAWGGPQTTIGKLIIACLFTPLAIGFLFTVIDGARRLSAQAELRRRSQKLDESADAAIAQVNENYEKQAPLLQESLEEAKARLVVAETLLRSVQGLVKKTKQAA